MGNESVLFGDSYKKPEERAKDQMESQKRKDEYYRRQERNRSDEYTRARNKDLKAGAARGEQIFGGNALGRIDAQRSGDVSDILSRRKEQLSGFSQEEQNALRDNNMKSIYAQQQAGSRDLRRQQAAAGVRGALGSAQQSAFQQATQRQLGDQERQLFLQDVGMRRGALDQYEQSTRATEGDELGREKFNLGQQNKELLGKLQTELGFGSLGAQERAAAIQSVLGDKAMAGSKEIAAASGGKK